MCGGERRRSAAHPEHNILFLSTRDIVEMFDGCNQEIEMNGDESPDDDSQSLLRDLNVFKSIGAAEDMEVTNADAQFGSKEQGKKVEREINGPKPPVPGTSSCAQTAAGSQSCHSAKISKKVRSLNKKQLNKKDSMGETILHKACRRRDLAEVRALIEAGINVNTKDNAGWTALHEAAFVGDNAVAEELLKAGADVNARSDDGISPLHDAVSGEHYQVMTLLLQHGSNSSHRQMGGLSAMDMAMEEKMQELLSLGMSSVIREQPCQGPAQYRKPAAKISKKVRSLNKKQLNKKDSIGETILHKACRRRDLAEVRALIEAGINVNTKDNAGWTALHEAAFVGDNAVAEELLKAGADVNARSDDGISPLHDAVSGEHYQVVTLLLQHGSNSSHRQMGGLSAMDMATEEKMQELLSLGVSSVIREQPCQGPAQYRQPGEMSSEAPCHNSISASCSKALSVRPGDLGDGDGVREPGDIQPKKKDTATDNRSHTVATRVFLEETGRKQTDVSSWPLIDLEDAGRYHAALIQFQDGLDEVLNQQQLEKDNIDQKLRMVSDPLRHRLLKSRLVSLSLCQRTLVELLQKQMLMEEVYLTAKARLSNDQSSAGETQQLNHFSTPDPEAGEAHSSNDNGQRQESHQPVTQPTLFGSAPLNPTQPDGPQLSDLIQRGVIPSGSAIELVLKGHWHLALLLDDGSIKDSKGKLHLTPERWLEFILNNNIPVSSTHAWDQVTFRGKSLSYYALNLAEGHSSPDVQQCRAASSGEVLTPEDLRKMLINIKIVHLVGDEEWLPSAQSNLYWKKLLAKDHDDWGELSE
ncbi:ankyrin repeat domain-containing protein 31-like [Gymnodraco acuticeps]|uniref:Ankyrin repeat domain-containing protein 31-like n=1 Tax=Gymnodraco acuticeps TaxID=8218 RepID=A0A6P8TCN4_GYMAC|nr:ankyrin repeat domain-containing protein 31-like [Gymnodraco acuticeps]